MPILPRINLKNTSAVWLSIFLYFIIVELIILIKDPELLLDSTILINRLVFLFILVLSFFFKPKLSKSTWLLFTILAVYSSLTILYKETAVLNVLFYPSLDTMLQSWDYTLFGFQPAIEFSEKLPYAFFSEMMYFGYFSYYLMPLVILFLLFKKLPKKIEEFGFLVITSFLIYYLIFIMFPAVGPQFYFKAPENEIQAQGFFGKTIKLIQENGEAKTAAFPSSHVGVALIMMMWLFFNLKKYFIFFIPTVCLLILATVYIKAHYAVDVFTGMFSAPIIYYLSLKFYKTLSPENVNTN